MSASKDDVGNIQNILNQMQIPTRAIYSNNGVVIVLYEESATQEQRAQAQAVIDNYVSPDMDGFMQAALLAAMAQPPEVPLHPLLYFEIVKLEYSLRKYAWNPAYTQGSWMLLKSIVQAQGVTAEQCQAVEAIAVQYHIPLLAE